MSGNNEKGNTMSNNDYEHFFGFACERFMLDWAAVQFDREANTFVSDVREIVVTEEWESEECCGSCYTEDVWMKFEYQDASLWYKGKVTVTDGVRDFVPDYEFFDVDTPR